MIRKKKIFITGGAGFIGTSLIKRVIDDNKIVVYDNLHRNAIRYSGFLEHPNVEFIEGDVLDCNKIRDSIKGCNIVIHMASIAGVDTVLSMPVKTMEVALIGTYNVLKAAKEICDVERFISFSTSEVFGAFALNVKESDSTTIGPVGEPRWTYAVSKLATEHLAISYFRQFGFPAVTIRPFNIFGPKQVGVGAIHTFITSALKNKTLYINNTGKQVRSWCYIDDIVDAVMLCLEKDKSIGQAFNVGTPQNTITICELADMIKRLCKSESKILFADKKITDVELRAPDIKKAKDLLGFEPKVRLEDGLVKTIEWYRENMDNEK